MTNDIAACIHNFLHVHLCVYNPCSYGDIIVLQYIDPLSTTVRDWLNVFPGCTGCLSIKVNRP